ncbi:MAG: T9SS type A sorting domain-containing protein [Bacteroidota bacterium]|nr:T9SS type A sorting domain-containing protein [Bacteroidota bacterium]
MVSTQRIRLTRIISLFLLLLSSIPDSFGRDYNITGIVTDANGGIVPNTRISMVAGTTVYAARSGSDGRYYLRISNIYDIISGMIETGIPYPNPFSYSVNIPFIINSPGEIRFSVYNFSGQKILEVYFDSIDAGSYHIVWDGCNQGGAPQRSGLYYYAITFKGRTRSGKLIKASGYSTYSAGNAIEPDMMAPAVVPPKGQLRFPVVTNVTSDYYYPVRLTDITIGQDTIINFDLTLKQEVPYKTQGNYIAMHTGAEYRSLMLKGINLGSSPPGYFPGEIGYAISADQYEKWIRKMANAGFNCIRVYTLHPPAFYEKLADYNQRHQDNPLLLFQGIWLDEVEDASDPESNDLLNRVPSFTKEIHEVIDCINGNGDIAYRYGKSYGRYLTDVSRWTAGYIIGREISPQEVDTTDNRHPETNSFSGSNLSITGGKASEVFVTEMLDATISYEAANYTVRRPVSISSWPTLDPLTHPTELFTDEDKASYDLAKISLKIPEPGIFASFHAYPYYPNFVSEEPAYQAYSDSYGPDSYLGYLNALKAHFSNMPLVVAEFGVPSSWGSAHQSFSNMHHGGYSEQQQGEKDLRLMHNIIDANCAGGFMFAWMDEWFKPTWIVSYLEAYGMVSDGVTIPTRQLWHNLASPEQNFGLVSYDQTGTLPFVAYQTDRPSGPLKKVSATNDNSCFFLEVEANRTLKSGDTVMVGFDTYISGLGESLLPNGKVLNNRSEFLLTMVLSDDTALYHVTEAYDMNGLTPRFDLTNHVVQKFQSTVTDGAPWKVMQWINDGYTLTHQDIGKVPMENSATFSFGQRTAVAWKDSKIEIRIPWTMLYFRDPTQMKVIDGAVSYDGGYNYEILTASSDGIAVSVYFDGVVTSSQSRYTWPLWLIVPPTVTRDKRSLQIVGAGLTGIPGFVN